MENTSKLINLGYEDKSLIVVFLTAYIVLIMIVHFLGFELLSTTLVNIGSSSIGVFGGYYYALRLEKHKETEKVLNVRKNILSILSTEIYNNKMIYMAEYADEKDKEGNLDLSEKPEFQTKEWDMFKFKIYTDGIDIINKDEFQQLVNLYQQFETVNLHKKANALLTEKNKNEILHNISDNIWDIENKLSKN